MTEPLDIHKRYLSEAFRGEITPARVLSFQGRLIEPMQTYKSDPRLITLFKEVLETADKTRETEALQSMVSSNGPVRSGELQRLAFHILLFEKMETMLRSRIEALESDRPEERLQSILSSEGVVEEKLLQRVFSAMQLIPKEHLDRALRLPMTRLFEGISNDYHGRGILPAMKDIPEEQRVDVIEKTLSVLQELTNEDRRADVLRLIGEVSPEQRTPPVVRSIVLLFRGISDDRKSEAVMRALLLFPPAERHPAFIQSIAFLVQGIVDGYQKAVILLTIHKIPKDQRTPTVMQAVVALFRGIKDYDEMESVFELVRAISEDDRADVIEKSIPAMEDTESTFQKRDILHAMRLILPDRRIEAIRFVNTCKSLTKGAVLQIYACILPEAHVRIWQNVLAQLDKIHSPSLQEETLLFFGEVAESWSIKELFESDRFERLFPKDYAQIFRLFAALFWKGQTIDASLDVFASALNAKAFKDAERKKIVLSAFHTLSKTKILSAKEKTDLLKVIFSSGSKSKKMELDKINRSLLLMETICNFGRADELKKIETPADLESSLKNIFESILSGRGVEYSFDRYLETFGSFRDPASLTVYMSKLRSPVSEALNLYMEEVLTGAFPASRYEETTSEHLSKIFKGREELKRQWTGGKKMKFEEILPSNELPNPAQVFDLKEYLQQRIIADTHISHEKVPYLVAYLQETASNLPDLAEEIGKSGQGLDRLKLQEGLLFLLKDTSDNRHEIFRSKVEPFIKTALDGEEPFLADLVGLGKLLAPRTKENSYEGWTSVDTDDPQDLLLCGTEVVGSCQNIRGSPDLNKCLPAYLLDGKNRLIAVKDRKGRIVARLILRILWDEKKQMPVLFKERVYLSSHADAKVTEALDRMCLLRAEELRLALVAQTPSHSESAAYPNELKSLGSRAPFEYTDAGGGITNGTFSVTGILVADFSAEGNA